MSPRILVSRPLDFSELDKFALTAGLNKPPLIRKNTQTFTMSEKPKDSAMYNSTSGLKPVSWPVVVLSAVREPTLAT